MNLEPNIVAFVWPTIVERTRDLPTVLPTTRAELQELQLRVGYAHLAVGVGAAGPEVERFLDWYRVNEKEIEALEERFGPAAHGGE